MNKRKYFNDIWNFFSFLLTMALAATLDALDIGLLGICTVWVLFDIGKIAFGIYIFSINCLGYDGLQLPYYLIISGTLHILMVCFIYWNYNYSKKLRKLRMFWIALLGLGLKIWLLVVTYEVYNFKCLSGDWRCSDILFWTVFGMFILGISIYAILIFFVILFRWIVKEWFTVKDHFIGSEGYQIVESDGIEMKVVINVID